MALVRKLQALALNPTLTAPLPLAIAFGPPALRARLLAVLSRVLSANRVEALLKALKVLAVLGVLSRANQRLNKWALNNWRWASEAHRWDFKREVAVVTGGSSGIGKEIARQLLRKGTKVAVFDVQPLPKDLEGYADLIYIHCDVTSQASIADAALKLRVKWGDPSILINNAGVGKPHPIVDAPNDWVTKVFTINIISHFWLIKEFMPAMLEKNKGHIVGIASMASFVAPAGVIDYAATKAGVLALHEGLNQELRHVYKKTGVLNTVVHPHWVKTPLVGGYESHLEKTQGKLLSPETIGRRVVQQIVSCSGGQVFVPSGMGIGATIRAHSNWVQEIIRDVAVGGAAARFPGA